MPKYIERETLLKHAIALNNPHELGENVVPVSDIEAAPAADVAEVVHGRWLTNSDDGYYPYCSVCKEEPKSGIMTPYCPNCGCKMDKEDET
jgi:hypothetical protein